MLELAGAIAIVVGIGYLIRIFLIFLDSPRSTYKPREEYDPRIDSSDEDRAFEGWAKRYREEMQEDE